MRFLANVLLAIFLLTPSLRAAEGWPQFGHDAQHGGGTTVGAQSLQQILADVVYDPFVDAEEAYQGGELLVHYQVPLVDGDDVFMEFKSGTYNGPDQWQTQIWSVHLLRFQSGTLTPLWSAPTDWKPVPDGGDTGDWEPVFHAALANGFLYEPGAGGTLLQIDRSNGSQVKRVNPFGLAVDSSYFTVSPLVVDPSGNVLYTVVRLNSNSPWTSDARGAWLVRVTPDGVATAVSFSAIVSNAPAPGGNCTFQFDGSVSPLPPSPSAVAPSIICGSPRPAVNAAPAVGADGTIYVVARTHFNGYWSYLAAINADLTPKWSVSLRNRFHDGCGVLLPPNGSSNGCRSGTTIGVDPADNQPGSGIIIDNSSASPAVAPDGSILFGVYNSYNDQQGHLMHFDAHGTYLGAYGFGWDTTPAIYAHDGTYSIIEKENHYGGVVHSPGYYITQLDPAMNVEWQYKNANLQACGRNPQGTVFCVPSEPYGFEWCVNAPAVDDEGTVYANSEDGNLYAIGQGGILRQAIFLQLALGAGYTPVAIGSDGRLYAQNAGHLFVVGGLPHRRVAGHG
jgi:hypothetical protein